MVQWYAFAALAVALFVGLNARDWWQRRRRS